MTGRIYLEDPKQFYRLLESILTPDGDTAGRPPPLEKCVREFFESVRQDRWLRGALLYEERRGAFRLVERFGRPGDGIPDPFPILHPALRPLLEHATCYFPLEDSPEETQNEAWLRCEAAAAILITGDRTRHVLVLLLDDSYERTVADFVLSTLRTVLTARILQNRWRNALQEAAEIQRGLLPLDAPVFPGFRIAARSVPAEEVGGDFFDFFDMAPDTMGLAIGDVSGHGLPAALVARDVLVGLRMGVDMEMKISRVLTRLNRVIHVGILHSSFVSAFYGELEADGTLFYVNAGQTPPLHFSSSGAAPLLTGDPVLGPIRDVRFTRRVVQLEPGDLLVLYTDGIVERHAASGEIFGEKRLEAVVGGIRHESPWEILDAVFDAAAAFGDHGRWEDDATLVVIQRERVDGSVVQPGSGVFRPPL